MLPTALTSQYQQYKRDTNAIVGWLVSTAMKLGYVFPPTAEVDENPAQQTTRDEDTPRRTPRSTSQSTSRSAAQKPKTSASWSEEQRHIVALAALPPLAAYIVTSHGDDTTVLVPEAFARALDRVIAVEKNHGANLVPQGAPGDKESEKCPSCFIGVFEEVHAILGPLLGSPEKVDMAKLANELAALHLEPVQVFVNVPGYSSHRPQSNDEGATYEANIAPEGAFLAFTMMMHDVYLLRNTVKWIWRMYRDGHFELASASLATNTAMELVRDLMEEVLSVLGQHDAVALAVIHFKQFCRSRGVADADTHTTDPEDNFNYDLYDVAEETMFNACRVLDLFLSKLQHGHLLSMANGGAYDPVSDRSKKSGRQKFQEDKYLLLEFLSELAIVSVSVSYGIKDSFMRGMDELIRTKKIPLHLVFAAQIYLDIHHELREKAEDAFKNFFREAISAQVDLAKHLDFPKNVKVEKATKKHNEQLRELKRTIEAVTKDELREAKEQNYRASGLPPPRRMEKHLIFKRSPLMSGLVLHLIRTGMHATGIQVANAWGSIMYSCHLYHAYQNVRMQRARRWPDMDLAETNLDTSNFYDGERPETLNRFNEEFFHQMGIFAASVSEARVGEGCRMPRIGAMRWESDPREFEGTLPVTNMFMTKDRYAGARANWTPENVEDVIIRGGYTLGGSETTTEGSDRTSSDTLGGSRGTSEGSRNSQEGSLDLTKGSGDSPNGFRDSPEGSLADGSLATAEVDESKVAGNTPEEPSGPKPAAKRRPEELVKALALALQNEAVEIAFPYLHFHRVCWGMLRAVHESCRVGLFKACGPGYMKDDRDLPFVVGYIFMDAVGVGSGVPDPALLVMAARVMDEELGKGMGDRMITVLKKEKGLRL